ncbi:DUF2188 domain-containing protein [Virgibacillus sp. 179-BFC.A HS]|uniref:DUF2188 domain-containing protein n=1 Tax=Tigheibacillus jepli TaxID=3035914 RepID=A0ABU5CKS7_9BACI|nr:DUF2188 domain-containing protein [Virgibacillus sp. 179-BFC.A HS]MDY0406967.1 DUF2188 domain-containing protein [Virgibacillus sp. 179-BFC.A HS]
MPWTMDDYPSSLKNLEYATKKKAIDIANAMVDEGYDENRAIPIATKQAKEWRENASKKEVEDYVKYGKPTTRKKDKQYENNPERLEEGEKVVPHEDGWAVQSFNAKKPSNVYKNKDDAIKKAREIARNKGTHLTIYKQDGKVQKKEAFESKS